MIQQSDGAVRTKYFPAGWNVAGKPCDFCNTAAALLFCPADSAFLCMACDARAHNVVDDKMAAMKHGRIWMCDVCQQAPAAVTCKADAAALCFNCDQDIHSANPLARRHERAPVVPFYDTAESMAMKSAAATLLMPVSSDSADDDIFSDRKVEISTAQNGYNIPEESWISSDPIITPKLPADTPDIKSLDFLFADSDPFIDFDNCQICSQPFSDSIVPVQTTMNPAVPPQNSLENRFEIDFTRSSIPSYSNSYTGPSLSHSISSSSLDVGVVPDGSAVSETSCPLGKTGSRVVGMDREARVLRYKEKRKNRKFEKTIRYASRKAYAETRPRIKGRFAKRTDSESDLDGLFGSGAGNFFEDARYGVVPSF